jgi:flagellar motility protein MotE (MotC chaperone)
LGIEEGIKRIETLNKQVLTILIESQDFSQIRKELEKSLHNFSVVVMDLESKFQENARSIVRQVQESYSGLNPQVIASIAQLPPVLVTLEESLGQLQTVFRNTQEDIKKDLDSIKASYVTDIVGRMGSLSKNITETVATSTEKTNNQYESSITSFVAISEDLKGMGSNLSALIENQTDQLATIGELRDRVNAIIQVELASLRDRITIYLENSVNELKTSVTERLGVQDGTLQRLTQAVEQLYKAVIQLPDVIKNEVNMAVDSKLIATIQNMEQENKKMSAIIIRTLREKQG